EMHKPMEVMRACLDELLTHWGIDAAAQRTLTRKVKPLEQMEWAKDLQSAYPSNMLRKGQSGIVRVRLIVGPTGKPQTCHIQVPSDDPSFEQTACSRLMRSARFEPALDASGKAITSYYVTSILYLIN
ncbi:MAG TPA: TonB family protein, partial [Reyranella sp.]|nr:TonB family protein [Reyranella sp.]